MVKYKAGKWTGKWYEYFRCTGNLFFVHKKIGFYAQNYIFLCVKPKFFLEWLYGRYKRENIN